MLTLAWFALGYHVYLQPYGGTKDSITAYYYRTRMLALSHIVVKQIEIQATPFASIPRSTLLLPSLALDVQEGPVS